MLLIKNGRILTMTDQDYEQGDILIEGTKIIEVGEDIFPPEGTEIIDAKGTYVTPGFIDAHCHLGMWEDGIGFEGADGNEDTDPITPQLSAIDAINPFDPCFKEAYEHGITTAVTGPGSANVIGGQFVALKTYGRRVEEMIFKSPVAMKIALGENPKRVYDEKNQSPTTRMATAALLREHLRKAQEYQQNKLDAQEDEELDKPEYDIKLEALAQVLDGKLPVKAHAHRADDILTAIRIAKEFNLKMTIEHCTEGHLIADILKEEGYAPILGPLFSDRSKVELKNMSMKAPGQLAKVGIPFAMMTDHPVIPIQYLPVVAALSVREGLDEMEALKSISLYAAQIVGIDDRVGSIEKGKDADIVLWTGHPFDYMTRTEKVLVNGKVVYDASL